MRALLLALVLFSSLQAERHAVLVGNAHGGPQLERLRYVRNDITSLQDVLTDLCGFEPENITVLYNNNSAELSRALQEAADRVKPDSDDLFFFYYSGHGDGRFLRMGNETYSLATLRTHLDKLPARIRIAVLDACQSGGFTRPKGGKLAEPFLFREDSKVQGQVTLYSSSSTENSQESDAYKNSIFTFHFINALRGCGDMSQDGKVTLAEAYQYSYNNTISSTLRSSGGVQHPGYDFRIQGEGDIVLADLNLHTQGILLQEHIEGAVTIVDGNGGIVADFSKDADSRFVIALNPGHYQIITAQGNRRERAYALVEKGQAKPVRKSDFVSVGTTWAASKGTTRGGFGFGVAVTAGMDLTNYWSLSADLDQRYDRYDRLNLSPSLPLPDAVLRGGMLTEIQIKGGLLWQQGIEFFRFTCNDVSAGRYADPFSADTFSSRLESDMFVQATVLETGPGYRIPTGALEGIFFHIGINAFHVDMTLRTTLSDERFDYEVQKEHRETGWNFVPFLAAGYLLALHPRIDAGLRMRYRYDRSPSLLEEGILSENSAAPVLNHTFGGYDMAALIMFDIKQLKD